jgi:anti-sigma B factor antagonist
MSDHGPVGLSIEERSKERSVALLLGGELDIASAPRLQKAIARLCEDGARALTLDLSGLLFIDSTGLAAIVYASRLCDRHDCELALIPGPEIVQQVFELTGLAELLPFRSDADGAPSA